MACKIEIEKSINNSIEKQLPNREAVMSKAAAKSIVDYLNNLWNSAVARIIQYSGQGGYKVKINSLTPTIEKEFKKQEAAEDSFERNLDFFNGDVALMEQEDKDLLFQTNESTTSTASKEVLSKVKDVLKQIGVVVQDIVQYAKSNPGVNINNVNGVADLVNGIIAISEGKENVALTEEMVHIATAIIEQKNPKLITEIISKINRFKIYKTTLEQYKDNPQYQLPNGKPDIRKIKKEAADKLIAELIINDGNTTEQFPEFAEEENRSIIRRIWNSIKDWFSGQYKKSNIDIFQEVSENIMNEEIGSVLDLDSSEIYYQLSEAQETFVSKLEETGRVLRKQESNEPIDPLAIEEEGANSYYELLVDGSWERITKRVTDNVKRWYKAKFGNTEFTKQEKIDNEFKRQYGVNGHHYFEEAHARFFENGKRRKNPLPKPEIKGALENEMYDKIEKYYTDLIAQFSTNGKNPLVYSEVQVYDEIKKEAGTIDLLIVEEDGTANIFDWKFMSVAKGAEDVAWYKQGAYGVQLRRYKEILKDFYNIKKIGKNRAIPIIMDLVREDPKDKTSKLLLKGIALGSVDPTKIEDLKFLPVSEESESTGIAELDALIEKLNAIYEQVSKTKSTDDVDRAFKRERMNVLKKAIRTAQGTLNIAPLVDVIQIMRKEGQNLIDEYKASYEGRPANSEDFTDVNLSDYADNAREYLATALVFGRIDDSIADLIYVKEMDDAATTEEEKKDVEARKKLLISIRDEAAQIRKSEEEIKKISGEFADKFIGQKNLVTGLTTPEGLVKGLKGWFRSMSALPMASLQVLYKLINRASGFARQDALEETNELLAIRDKLKARGGDLRSLVKAIYQKNEKNEFTNKLISRFSKDFYKDLEENSLEGNRSKRWLADNVDLEAYSIEAKAILDESIRRINLGEVNEERKYNLIEAEEKKWNINRPDFNGFNNYVLKRHPKTKWETKEYKDLQKDEDLFQLYTFISKINSKAKDVGYIDNRVASTFLPFIRKTMAESIAWDFSLSAITNFSANITSRVDDVGYGNINKVTGELENSIPKYYTTDFTLNPETGVNDYSDVSEDLFKNMILYINHMEKYKYLEEVEGQVKLLKTIETFKGHLETNKWGKVKLKDGKPNPLMNEGSESNIKIFDEFLRSSFYGQKYVADGVDVALGDGVVTRVKKGINNIANKEVFPIEESTSTISLVKSMDALNRAFQLKTLGFEFISGAVNIFGGNIQLATQAGRYFKAREIAKNELMLIGNKFANNDQREMFIQLVDTFMPLKDDPNYEKMKQAGMSKLTQQNFSDLLFVFFRQPEQHLEKTVFVTLLDNMMVEDGKIVNISEYVKNKYKGRYSSKENYRSSSKQIKAEIEELKKTRSISSTKELVNGKLVIPGLDLTNKEELQRLTNLTKSISQEATGNMTEADNMRMNMSIWTRSMMVFKGWIPKLVDTRFGEFRKISDDFSVEIDENGMSTGDKYDIGRIRLFGSFLSLNVAKTVTDITDVLLVNDKGILQLDKMYNKYAENYFNSTGQKLTMTKEDFNDLIINNLRNQIKELAILMSLFGAMLSLGYMEPDDDADKATKNFYRFSQKVVDKFVGELMFFYNPADMQSLLGGSVLPAIGLFTDVKRFTNHFFMETTGLDFSNPDLSVEEVRKKAQPVKYMMKMLPVAKSAVTYFAIFSEQFAKDFDVTIQKQNRR